MEEYCWIQSRKTFKNESGESYFSQVRFSEKPIVTDVTYSDKTTTVIHFAGKVLGADGEYADSAGKVQISRLAISDH